MKSDYRGRAIRFLHTIFPYIKDCLCDYVEVEERIKEYSYKAHRNIIVNYGSARIALITSDYVIKWDYDEESVYEIGGCEDEYSVYEQAKEQGFDYLLAETTLVYIGRKTFTIMPRIYAIGPQYHKGNINCYLTDKEYAWVLNFIYDVHHYNWGIRNGKACLIDYAMSDDVANRSPLMS